MGISEKLEQVRDHIPQKGGRQGEAEQQMGPEPGPRNDDPDLSAELLDLAAHERRPGGAFTIVRRGLRPPGEFLRRLAGGHHDLVIRGGIHQRKAQETGDVFALLAGGGVSGGAGQLQLRPAPLPLQHNRVAIRRVRIPLLEAQPDAVVAGDRKLLLPQGDEQPRLLDDCPLCGIQGGPAPAEDQVAADRNEGEPHQEDQRSRPGWDFVLV